jgi:hypothetical protein
MRDVGAQGPVLVEEWDDLAVGLEEGCYLGRNLRTTPDKIHTANMNAARLDIDCNRSQILTARMSLVPNVFTLDERRSNHMQLLAVAKASIYLS